MNGCRISVCRRLLLAAALFFVSVSAYSGSVFPKNYSKQSGQVSQWVVPNNLSRPAQNVWEEINYGRAPNGGVFVTRSGPVALPDTRPVTVVAKGVVNGAVAFQAAKVFLGGGPGIAIAVLSQLPSFLDWLNEDGGEHIRFDQSTASLQKKDSSVCSVAPCYLYNLTSNSYTHSASTDPAAACGSAVGSLYNGGPAYIVSSDWNGALPGSGTPSCHVVSSIGNLGYANLAYQSVAPVTAEWLPASMDDIAPYMEPKPLPFGLIPELAEQVPVPIDPLDITTTGPTALPPSTRTTDYPPGPSVIIIEILPGNPYGLADGVPTEVGSSTGHRMVEPGSSSTTGSATWLPPKAISVPTTSTTTATRDDVTDQTTKVTETTTDHLTVEETKLDTTVVTNVPTTSTATTTITTTTVTTNITKGGTTTTTGGTTTTDPSKPPLTDCEKYPDSVGCTKLGEPPVAETLPSSEVAISLVPAVFASFASCPGDLTVPVDIGPFHSSAVFTFSSICDAAVTTVAPLVLLLGFAAAGFIFVGGLKS